ncbi:RNA polymerase sigma factor [Streptomyces sp. NPDC058620]|uniref:RNA polymerase sigma factor n=1 Tax=Streptomyces sp. NPDC058620 TaxID=3346560 RepID=UPI00365E1006
MGFLQRHPLADRTEIVAEVERACGGLDSGEHAGAFRGHRTHCLRCGTDLRQPVYERCEDAGGGPAARAGGGRAVGDSTGGGAVGRAGGRTGSGEAAVVTRVRAGAAEAYAQLVRAHTGVAPRVAVAFGAGADAEGVVRSAFLKAYQSLGRFRGGAAFRPWLLRIVVNETRNTVRSACRARAVRPRGRIPWRRPADTGAGGAQGGSRGAPRNEGFPAGQPTDDTKWARPPAHAAR